MTGPFSWAGNSDGNKPSLLGRDQSPLDTPPHLSLFRTLPIMNARHLSAFVCLNVMVLAASAADQVPKKQATKEEIQARLAEHARKKATGSAVPVTNVPKPAPEVTPPNVPATGSVTGPETSKSLVVATAAPAASETPKVLPKVEVRKGRITELDRQVAKQNEDIAREKKNTKPTPLDETLNGGKVSSALAIFGGQSSNDRSIIAQERVSMMEDERDLIEAIAQATTKEEKVELQKTLDSMRAMRRELEKSLR